MLFRLRNTLDRALHDWRCKEIFVTPPLKLRPAPLVFCSMVSQRDLTMYLVAIKSMYSQVGEGSICIIDDGSLTKRARDILQHHLGSPTVVDIATIDTGRSPRGGCWERLLHILDLARDSYVIQVDSDILARGPIPEVVECYRENRSFALGTWGGRWFISLAETAAHAQSSQSTHIQVIAESVFDQLPHPETRRYVRGCAGFSGFARGSSRAMAEAFSADMQRQIGARWAEWGSEQVTSNYVVANSEGSQVLLWPKYTNHGPSTNIENTALLHFIGDHRFYRGRYSMESRRVIAALCAAG